MLCNKQTKRNLTILLMAAAVLASGLALTAWADKPDKPPKPGGGDKEPLTNPALVFSRDDNLYLTTSDGSVNVRVMGAKDKGHMASAWSPDGTQIAFLQRIESGKIYVDLYTVRPDGTEKTLIYSFDTLDEPVPEPLDGLAWSPDGTKIMYKSCTCTPVGLWVVDVTTSDIQRLGQPSGPDEFRGGRLGSFGPDLDDAPGFQGMICYTYGDITVVELFTDENGTLTPVLETIRRLPRSGNQIFPVFSPDGGQIAFLDTTFYDGGHSLLVVDFDADSLTFGTPQVLLENDPSSGYKYIYSKPTWSPDNEWIAFVQGIGNYGRLQDIFRIRPDGTGLTNVTNEPKHGSRYPDWNPEWANDID